MKQILFVFPTAWDRRQLEACRPDWEGRYQVHFAEPTDVDCEADLDPVGWLEETAEAWGGRVDGVTSSSDYPGATLGAALAQRLGLRGPEPAAVLRASHKYYSRITQQESVPEATPGFDLVPSTVPLGDDPSTGYPCFVKPIKGAFSMMSGKIRSRAELEAFLARPAAQEFAHGYLAIFNRLVAHLTDFEIDGRGFVAEEFLHGRQVTVEGWIRDEEVGFLGIVDSIFHPDYPSFARFDYPSVRRPEVQDEMRDIVARVIRHLGLDHALFNVELIYEPVSDRVSIIEINPRLCGQFADLYRKVDGVSGYVVALALAAGDPLPEPAAGRRYRAASSFPLRTYVPVRVARAPSVEDVAAAEALHEGNAVWIECEAGAELSDFEAEDGWSSRYGVVNLGGDTRREIREKLTEIEARLGFRMEPV